MDTGMANIEIIDKRFKSCVLPNAPLEKLGEGFRWLEGPVWFADLQCLLVSDIPNNRVMRWSAAFPISLAPSLFIATPSALRSSKKHRWTVPVCVCMRRCCGWANRQSS